MIDIATTLVLSLPEDAERRRHIAVHFSDIGLVKYHFVEALGPRHRDVVDFYRQGRVKAFPPCFRCGLVQCSCSNNFIIPQQVANWLSFRKVWMEAAQFGASFVLICEDDVAFHKGALEALQRFAGTFSPSKDRVLLRISESGSQPFLDISDCDTRISSAAIMSNPTYLINGHMAAFLVEQFSSIATTSDIWLHREMALHQTVEALTLEPVLATELSYNPSHARFLSRIHPKGITTADKERAKTHRKRAETAEEYASLLKQWGVRDA